MAYNYITMIIVFNYSFSILYEYCISTLLNALQKAEVVIADPVQACWGPEGGDNGN